MAEVRLSVAASRDLDAAFDFGAERWGVEKATEYLRAFDDAFALLAQFPHLGTTRDEISPGACSMGCGSHTIWFRLTDSIVTITRVLHTRMDIERRR